MSGSCCSWYRGKNILSGIGEKQPWLSGVDSWRKCERPLSTGSNVQSHCRYYKPGLLLMCFILPTVVPWYFWGETFLNSLCVSTFLRYAVVLNATWLVNSAAHLYGYRPYDKNISSRENILVSMGAVGKYPA